MNRASVPFNHIVVLMQENRTFDNYFWTYPGQVGYNPSLCMPLTRTQGCMRPWQTNRTAIPSDLPHDWVSTHIAYDNGSMDGFMRAASNNPYVMSYYDEGTLPYLWFFARNYVLADEFFTSAKSYSQPNHWYMIAGRAPNVSLYENAATERNQCYNQLTGKLTLQSCEYINQANEIETMAEILTEHGISWKYYDLPAPENATLAQAIEGKCRGCNPFDYWNPLMAKNATYTDRDFSSSVVPRIQFFWDVANGTLPQVSWIIPSPPISDHPPANITLGMWWITYVADTIMKSKYWYDTVLIVLWDDYGGFFDTVKPPNVDNYGLSFRCPALIISAYSKSGFLDHTIYSFESVLRFIEWRFNLPFLSERDKNANNILNAFDLSHPPRGPKPINMTDKQVASIMPYIFQGYRKYAAQQLQFVNNDPD